MRRRRAAAATADADGSSSNGSVEMVQGTEEKSKRKKEVVNEDLY